jgi:Fe2+ or Zn2+ uptake regulation protein
MTEINRYEAILDLLTENPEGLSVHRVTEALNAKGILTKSTGQTYGRLRTLLRRGRVVRVEGERGAVWKIA